MAASRRSGSMSIGKGSDIIYDFSCSPCSKEGKNVEAIKYCVECDESLCSMCLKFHNRFDKMRNHQLLDKVPSTGKGQQHGSPLLPKEKCEIHHGKGIDMYCGTHDVVCCVTCIAVSHRPCKGVEYIPHVANTIRKEQVVNKVKTNVNRVRSDMEKLKKITEDDLKRITKQKHRILTQIKEFRDSISKQLDKMEKTATDELNSKYKKIEDQLNADLNSIKKVTSNLEKKATELLTFDGDNKSQLFVYVKQSNVIASDGDVLMNKIRSSVGKETLRFVYNRSITDTICQLKSLGTFPPTKLDQYNVRTSSDKSTCYVTGSCLLGNGLIMITDTNNKKVKVLDKSYKVTAECDLPCGPPSVCTTGPTEVAIALCRDKKIQFADVTGAISLTKSFSVTDHCRGVAYSDGELFVSCGGDGSEGPGHVEVYNTQGKLLRSLQNDKAGKQLFSCPLLMTFSLDNKQIHIADRDNGVITLDRNETKHHRFTDPDLIHAIGVCVTGDDTVLVCGLKSHKILKIERGQKKMVFLTETDGIKQPKSLCYNNVNAKLIVTMKDNDLINIYDMSSRF